MSASPSADPGRKPPRAPGGVGPWLRARFYADAPSACLSLAVALGAALLLPALLRWAVLDAVWVPDDPERCRAAAGACWAVIAEKHRVILFGTYPYDQQWRGVAVVAIVLALIGATMRRRWWRPPLALAWLAGLAAALALQAGGALGLPAVATSRWGGLPLTLLLFVGTVACGLPFAVLLALGRRAELPAIRALSVGYIETLRGVPLINVLFMASLMVPLFLPAGWNLDKLLRAQAGLALFFAAYAAEVVRGGLQAVPRGQIEAARALGLSPARTTLTVVLPQALAIVIPPLVNDVIRAFKNTSLLVIIGLFDVLGGTMAALEDPRWTRFYLEAYLFVAALYFTFCFGLSRWSRRLERSLRDR